MEPLGYYQVTSLSSAYALSSLSGAAALGANVVAIQAEGQSVRYRLDGTAPTTSVGVLMPVNQQPWILAYGYPLDATALAKIKLIETTAGATINIVFYKTCRQFTEF